MKGIDDKIERDYERLVAERYLPVFSVVARESANILREKNIPVVELGYPIVRLDFSKSGIFTSERKIIFINGNEDFKGLLEIAKIYQEGSDYRHSIQTTLKMCIDDLILSVRKAIGIR